jgi:hypothetical protein
MLAHQQNGSPRGLRDRQVRFRVSDACVPKPEEILGELHRLDFLEGRITDLTDSGTVREAFAVVEVSGLSRSVVVPVAKIVEIGQ